MPRPRKLSTDSRRITSPTESVVATMIGEITLGRICTLMMRKPPAPAAVAATTYSRSRTLNASPLTKRATLVQLTREMITMIR